MTQKKPSENNISVAKSKSRTSAGGKKATSTPIKKKKTGRAIPMISQAVDIFLSRARDIELAAKVHIPLSHERRMEQFDKALENLNAAADTIEKGTPGHKAKAMSMAIEESRRVSRLLSSDVPGVIENSLFLGLFSSFDAFTGNLLRAIYHKKPDLFERLDRSIDFKSILTFSSFKDLKATILEDEIEQFRRKSYIEQFNLLENTFGLTLRAFPHWPNFVECGQRRNLLTHNDGIISSQYIRICTQEGYSFSVTPKIGQRLTLGDDYFVSSCEVMMEVALKLGQTLWRKLFPTEHSIADDHLIEVIYNDCLVTEQWQRTICFGEFAIGQKDIQDRELKILTVNYAIGLKFSGNVEGAKRVLESVDWSGGAAEFRMAKAVLSDDFERASKLMLEVGKDSSIIPESGYHEFPLFRDFRKSTQFDETYRKVFGYAFATEIKRRVIKEKVIVERGLRKEDSVMKGLAKVEKSR